MRYSTMMVVEKVEVQVPGLGEKIRDARKHAGRSLKSLADEAGMSSQNWYRIEKEEQELTTLTLKKIEQVLGVDLGVEIDVVVNVKLNGKSKGGKKSAAK